MKVKALRSFGNGTLNMTRDQVKEIEETMAQDLIKAGYVVEVETCPTCGSSVEK